MTPLDDLIAAAEATKWGLVKMSAFVGDLNRAWAALPRDRLDTALAAARASTPAPSAEREAASVDEKAYGVAVRLLTEVNYQFECQSWLPAIAKKVSAFLDGDYDAAEPHKREQPVSPPAADAKLRAVEAVKSIRAWAMDRYAQPASSEFEKGMKHLAQKCISLTDSTIAVLEGTRPAPAAAPPQAQRTENEDPTP